MPWYLGKPERTDVDRLMVWQIHEWRRQMDKRPGGPPEYVDREGIAAVSHDLLGVPAMTELGELRSDPGFGDAKVDEWAHALGAEYFKG